jgi:hypothetical protein
MPRRQCGRISVVMANEKYYWLKHTDVALDERRT